MENQDNLLAKWYSGELTQEEYAMLKEQGILKDLERIKATTDRWNIPKYNAELGFKDFKDKHTRQKTKERKINWYWISAVAACFALVFFITKTMTGSQNQLLASNGKTESIEFADRTTITVNDGSSIKYAKENWISNRKIDLIGEASFVVSKGDPFLVQTAFGTVEVLGTKFNVRARGENLYVECYEGSVRVRSDNQTSVLKAQESVNIVSRKMNPKQIIAHDRPLWQYGTSRFYEEDVMSIFNEIEYQYDIEIKVSDLDRKFSGAFDHDDLDTALRNICKPLGLQYTIQENQKTVLIE